MLLASLTLVGCGSDARPVAEDQSSPGSRSAPATTPEATKTTAVPKPTESADRGTIITTDGSDYGTMLFDGTGQAIYLFDKETTDRPDCYRACATAWPPVLTRGPPRINGQVDSGLMGTTPRVDGSVQVTYGGHPLYYYIHDDKQEVSCHNVTEFGGLWLVVTPSGDPAAV